MPTVLITGANRGIGLEFTRQYAAAGWRILAGCRSPGSADDLRGLKGDIAIHALDVADTGSVSAAKAAIGSEPIDLLINNAGAIGQRAGKLGNVDYADWNDTLNINLLGPARVAGAFVDNVLASQQKKFATVSTRMSSMTECKAIDFMAYRTSKAAVNMMMTLAANELGPKGATVVLLHPGWVQTALGGPNAVMTPKDSVTGMRSVLDGLTPADNGRFINFDGTPIPW
jgi:NAD(P)-dependent dehydrogenase (short-subunit alcohol dehydrogenase family)